MQKTTLDHARDGQKQVITSVHAPPADPPDTEAVTGYALHNGAARSTEDVTVRDGTAPILERGDANDEESEETLDEIVTGSSGAPD